MKRIITTLLILVFCALMLWPFPGIPRLGPVFNYSSGIMQIKAPELTDQAYKHIEHDQIQAEIHIDSIGVPHIMAKNDESTAFAVGYMHARDRLFQMNLITRMVQGRLSEVFSERALKSDIFWRSFRMKEKAEFAMSVVKNENTNEYAIYQSYADGVNYYLQQMPQSELPEEFVLLDFKPEKWQALNLIYLNKYMSFLLTYKNTDVFIQKVMDELPEEIVRAFYPMQEKYLNSVVPEKTGQIDPNDNYIINKSGDGVDIKKEQQKEIDDKRDIGSNNWAVSASKSSSGKAILANDMHLALNLPGPWYEIHLKTATKHTYGLSIPGSPVNIVGTNGAIAWGLTNAHWDLVDHYKVAYASDDSLKYYLGDQVKTIDVTEDFIKVKGKSDYHLNIRTTELGPILNINEKEYVVQWIAANPSPEGEILLALERIKNWTEFKNALSTWETPPQNFIFADTAGNIGIYSAGKMPLRSKGKERGVFLTSDTLAVSFNRVPFESMPHIYNPAKGFIQSANQRQIFNADHYYNWATMTPPFRGLQIHSRLEQKEKLSPEDLVSIQADLVDRSAERMLPLLLDAIAEQHEYSEYRKILSEWDMQMQKERSAPLIYAVYLDSIFQKISDLATNGKSLIQPNRWVVMSYLEENEVLNFTDKEIERNTFIQSSFKEVIDAIINKYGDDSSKWAYGNYHQTYFRHLLRLPAFSPDKFASDGSVYTVNVAKGKTVVAGPSQRHVFHMTTPIEMHVQIAGGQSGRPSSKNFSNQLNDWKQVELRKAQYVDDFSKLKSIQFKIQIGAVLESN